MNSIRPFVIAGSGVFLPAKVVTSTQLDSLFRKPEGFSLRMSGPSQRYVAENETSSFMAAEASLRAIDEAGIQLQDLDLIISASAVPEQPIPTQAVLISRRLGLEAKGVQCFDVNATCLSFIVALDQVADGLTSGRYRNVLIVSSEIASRGLNWADPTNSVLFGDGAAAAVLRADPTKTSGIIGSLFETYTDGADYCQLRSGGTGLRLDQDGIEAYAAGEKYEMNGAAAYKMTADLLPGLLAKLLSKAGLTLEEVDIIIPHQASRLAMDHLTHRMGVPTNKVIDIYGDHGNQIAASLPTALHIARADGRIKKGMIVLLAGTAAGITIGGMLVKI